MENMEQEKRRKVIMALSAVLVLGLGAYFVFGREEKRKPLELNSKNQSPMIVSTDPANQGPVSPISGLPCENWNRRPLAVMQAGDVTARPAAGFSEADMVIEMPVITSSVTRLMALYVCNTPPEVGSMRSARHDFIHLAKGLDAVFVSWGRSESHDPNDPIGLAKGIMDRGEIENINCNGDAGKSANVCSDNPCFRKAGIARGVDSGYAYPPKLLACSKELGYRSENQFVGYRHVSEAGPESRPQGGKLRVAFGGSFAVEYDYDRATNSYLRTWGDTADVDRNTKKRYAPKNVIVLIARSDQIEGQYNNVQLGDPWYDSQDSGDAFYYLNGQEYRGSWKKDKADIASKLTFFDPSGNEMAFVPGQMWVEILEPGQTLRWTPVP